MEQYEINELAEQPWEETLEVLTADMDPHSIDICLLTERYREYIQELQEFDLEVPARAVRLCAALLKIKTLAVAGEEVVEEEPENPMDFEEEEEFLEDEVYEDPEPSLETGPDLDIPVKPRPRRRMSLDELKTALNDALEVKERREERRELRQQMDDPVDIDEKSLEEKVNSLFSRVTSLVSSKSRERIPFNNLVENGDKEEKIEKFLHVLHLENEQKVECIQDEWLGDLEVKPQQKPEVSN